MLACRADLLRRGTRAPITVTPAQLAIFLAAIVTLVGYVAFILVPAWGSYGRLWERFAAGFLTLFILASLVGIGSVAGLAIVWFYDRFV